jgi:hypothetical protein
LEARVKELSCFIDESGNYSEYKGGSRYYIVSLVFHDQDRSIVDNIERLDEHLKHLKASGKPIHTAPLIRREEDYVYMNMDWRRKIFNTLFTFFRHVDVTYKTITVEKKENTDTVELTAKLSRQLHDFLSEHLGTFTKYDDIIVYYDNGQLELTKLIASAFGSMLGNVSFRKSKQSDYKLSQVADLCCTLELVALKIEKKALSNSEKAFFLSAKKFRKSYLAVMENKRFPE